MFVKVKVSENLAVGSAVSFSSVVSAWVLAQDVSAPIGIIESVQQDEETLEYYAKAVFAGIAWALADRAIPDEGGEMTVLNGKVYVDNTADHCGIIAPLPRNQDSRAADDLVMVHIR